MNRIPLLSIFILLFVLSLFPLSTSSYGHTWLVRQDGSGDCTMIQACINLASSNDTVLVGPGTYFENLTVSSPMTLLGELGALQTIVDGGGGYKRCVTCSNASGRVYLRGLTITNGGVPMLCPPNNAGGGVVCVSAELDIKECRILSNFGGGVGCRSGSFVTVTDCYVADNFGWWGDPCIAPGHGIIGYGASGTVVRCSISNPEEGGIWWYHGSLSVSDSEFNGHGGGIGLDCVANATVSDNLLRAGSGIWAGVSSNVVISSNTIVGTVGATDYGIFAHDCSGTTISNNIVAFGVGYGMYCESSAISVICNDLWNNAQGDYRGSFPHPSDVSVDPLFCDPSAGDFHLECTSPCLNSPGCGQIGAFGVGCGPTAVNETTWGRVKALFR